MSGLIPIEIRFMTQADFNFIKNSYMKSYRSSYLSKLVECEVYNKGQSALFDRLMADSKVLIACSPDSSAQILGYLIYNPTKKLLHYCYVKHSFRKGKIATRLIEQVIQAGQNFYTHITPLSKSILFGYRGYDGSHRDKSQNWSCFNLIFNPFELCK